MSRTAHRKPARKPARRTDAANYRNRYVALAARVAKPGDPSAGMRRPATHTPAPTAPVATPSAVAVTPEPARPELRYVHEEELTGQAREEITEALRDFLTNSHTGEVDYSSDIEVAYHNGFLLTAAWLLFSATEADTVGYAFDQHGVTPHPDWWITDGWGAFHDKWGVQCPDCGTFCYARPHPFSDKPADADWPGTCWNCGHDMPAQHHTDWSGSDTTWWAGCSCGWETDKTYKTEGAAKGAITRHLKSVKTSENADA